ncbi:MAG: hypothetical protein PHE88_02015 [Elusimicrobia bacterium]|nr:hypothetical protein [Elusimicrobiota bacterium]
MNEPKAELTTEQLSLLIQIVNKGSYVGEQVELVAELKRALIEMLKAKQTQMQK